MFTKHSTLNLALLFLVVICSFPFFALQEKPKFDLKASMERGSSVYTTYCLSCHMDNGQGIEGVYPPLARADYLMADKKRSILQTIYGVSGEMKVNGVIYNGDMPGYDISDEEVSDVLNFIRNSWGNKGEAVRPGEVKALRK
jgi:mono/diheme cytochrome c family protein